MFAPPFPKPDVAALAAVLLLFLLASAWAGESPIAGDDGFGDLDFDLNEETDSASSLATLGGYFESRNQFRLKDGDAISLRQRLWLESTLDAGKIRGFASGYLDFDQMDMDWTSRSSERFHGSIHEAYLTLDTEYLDLIAGQKMVRWGTGDGVNPMDLINPIDHRDPVAGARSESRLPIPLIQAIARLSPLTFEGVFVPKAEVNKLPFAGNPWESAGLIRLRSLARQGQIWLGDQREPVSWLTDSEMAARVSGTWSGWDLALQYFNGFQDSPVLRKDVGPGGLIRFTPVHPRFQAFGFNFAKGFERGTLRGEFAVKPDFSMPMHQADPNYAASDGVVKRDMYEMVLGLDYTFFTNLYVNAQYFATIIEKESPKTAGNNFNDGMTFKVSDKFLNDDLELGIQGMASFTAHGWSMETYGIYKYDDHWSVTPGFMFYGGPATSSMGQHRDNSMGYLKIRYSF